MKVFSERACTTSLRDMLDLVALDLKLNHESEIGTKQSFSYDVSFLIFFLSQNILAADIGFEITQFVQKWSKKRFSFFPCLFWASCLAKQDSCTLKS